MWKYPGVHGFDGNTSQYLDQDPSIGLLYNYSLALGTNSDTRLDDPDRQGICPNGWRLPTANDIIKLQNEIMGNPTKYSNSTLPASNLAYYTNCTIGGIGSYPGASSKSDVNGGFALKFLPLFEQNPTPNGPAMNVIATYINDPTFQGTYLWTSTPSPENSSYQGIAGFPLPGTKINLFDWKLGYGTAVRPYTTMCYVRCVKK